MSAKEDGIFVSTKPDGQAVGYGDETVSLKIPVENLVLDDVFDDELHFRIPLKNKNDTLDVSRYLLDKNNADIQYSMKENDLSADECQKRFAENVDKVFSGEMPPRTVINIGDTPKLLQKYSASSVPITINQSVMYKIAYPAGYFGAEKQGHNLGIPALKQLPKQIADPVAILKSTSQDKSMILLTEWQDIHGNPVIIPLHLDKDGSIGVVNDVASAYGKQNFDALLTDSEGNSTVLYTKNNEDIHRLTQSGLQLPGASTEDTLVNYNIPNPEGNVKYSMKESSNDNVGTDSAAQDNTEIKPHSIQGTEEKTLIEAYNEAGASRTDREKFGISDIIPKVKQYGVKFMAAQVDKLYPIKSYERFADKQIHDGDGNSNVVDNTFLAITANDSYALVAVNSNATFSNKMYNITPPGSADIPIVYLSDGGAVFKENEMRLKSGTDTALVTLTDDWTAAVIKDNITNALSIGTYSSECVVEGNITGFGA